MTLINGFRVSSDTGSLGIKGYKVPGTSTVLPVRSEVAPLLIGFAREFHQKVEPLRTGWCWGYAYRSVRYGSTPSFHAAGIAIDLNAPRHPLGVRGTFSRSQRATINALAAKYGLRWGGNYRSRADEMHLEVIVSRSQALALVNRLQANPPSGTFKLPAGHYYGVDDKKSTSHSGVKESDRDEIKRIQRKVGASPDGAFGPGTRKKVIAWQKANRLFADGKVGRITWKKMGL